MADELSSVSATTETTDTSTQDTGTDEWGGKNPEDILKEYQDGKKARQDARAKETQEEKEKRKAEKAALRAKETPEEKKAREAKKGLIEKAKKVVREKPREGEDSEARKARIQKEEQEELQEQARRNGRRSRREQIARLQKEVQTASQIKKEGYAKFEEAARLRKQFAEIQNVAKQNPAQALVEIASTLGLGEEALQGLFQQRAAFEKEWNAMSPDQQKLYLANQRLAEIEGRQKAEADEATQKQQEQVLRGKQDAFEKELASKTLPAMKNAGLPQNALTLKMVAATLGALADRDGIENPPDIEEAVAYVAESFSGEIDNSVKAYAKDPKGFATRYPEVYAAVRQHSVAEARGAPLRNGGKPPELQTPRETETDVKAPSWSDFSRHIRNLQNGRR